MTPFGLLAAACAAVGFLTLSARSAALPGAERQTRPPAVQADLGLLARLRPVLVVLCLLGGVVVVGGTPGVVAGAGVAVWSWRVLGSAEGPASRRRRAQLEQDLPLAVHLLGACLRAGAAVSSGLATVADALPGPVAEEFRGIGARLALGTDPDVVWRAVSASGPLAPLGTAMTRAHRSGASVAVAIDQLSEDLRALSRHRIEARARTVEVRAAAPLGVCLLPSFLLLGVVPMAAGLFASLDFLG